MATATTLPEVLLVAYKLKKHSQLFNKQDRAAVMLIASLLYIYTSSYYCCQQLLITSVNYPHNTEIIEQ